MTSFLSGAALLTLVSLTVACHAAVVAGSNRVANQAALEDLVWSKVVATMAGEEHSLVVVEDSAYHLVPDSLDRQFMREQLTDLREETLQSFMRVNAVPRALPGFETLDVAVEHVGRAELEVFRGAGGPNEYWRAFFARYPGSPGLLRLSRVGFDETGEQALVFVYHACGGRCGVGKYVLLSPAGEQWEVAGDLRVFVH